MKKADLIKGIAQKAGITNEQAQNALEATLDLIKQSVVEQEDRITLHGFGTFAPSVRKARTGINLATKERLKSRNAKLLSSKQAKTLGSKNWLRLFPEG
jgi:DNA-binding protein HU-beta